MPMKTNIQQNIFCFVLNPYFNGVSTKVWQKCEAWNKEIKVKSEDLKWKLSEIFTDVYQR